MFFTWLDHHQFLAQAQPDWSVFDQMKTFLADSLNWALAAVAGYMGFKSVTALLVYLFKR